MLFFMIVYVIQKIRGNNNYLNSLNVMVNYHYPGENRAITRKFPSMVGGIHISETDADWSDSFNG